MKKSLKGNRDIVETFKKTIMDMHRGIPSYYYFGYLEALIPTKEMRDYMLKKDIFVKSKEIKNSAGQEGNFLGLNGMILANNYINQDLQKKTFRLNKQIKVLTWIMMVLAIFTLFATLNSIFKWI